MPNCQKPPKAEERKMGWESVSHGSHDDSHDSLARWLAVCQGPVVPSMAKVMFTFISLLIVQNVIHFMSITSISIHKLFLENMNHEQVFLILL